ncbi:hypothetical protein predicted by Glimmer/Critica [Lactiplantibacillus plantarum]|nr:hypothetical protein predicted by Glimmer/Critica [Lactiplantibacillus plantarum]
MPVLHLSSFTSFHLFCKPYKKSYTSQLRLVWDFFNSRVHQFIGQINNHLVLCISSESKLISGIIGKLFTSNESCAVTNLNLFIKTFDSLDTSSFNSGLFTSSFSNTASNDLGIANIPITSILIENPSPLLSNGITALTAILLSSISFFNRSIVNSPLDFSGDCFSFSFIILKLNLSIFVLITPILYCSVIKLELLQKISKKN